jgi:hypothetical protein
MTAVDNKAETNKRASGFFLMAKLSVRKDALIEALPF